MAEFRSYTFDTVIIGTGCAGYNAADWLYNLGRTNIAILTEGVNMGTSRNTGSDKQTYYKLALSGEPDSIENMAKTLYSGKSVDGDTAYTEAACSVKCFMKLCNLGVPFPTNSYGEYVGYQTDHDLNGRGTSAGPLTSKYMVEALQRQTKQKGIPIFDGMTVIQLLIEEEMVYGLIALDKSRSEDRDYGITIFYCGNIIMATGGPAGAYERSVYPESQTGMTGIALEVGVLASNLQEWQYGLASLGFRWNVSGTYQQALPRYISIDENNREEEILPRYFQDTYDGLNRVFLKGYQWPFDVNKLDGSSYIDLIVHHEIFNRGRRVFMDYRKDPTGLSSLDDFNRLSPECSAYLRNCNAAVLTPVKRLEIMNSQAIRLYKDNGVDLYNEPLEVGVCVQHNNGGLAVDTNWETNVKGLYAAGECAGTFGVYRPGGSALNSGQVGSMRAAEHIAFGTRERLQADARNVCRAIREARCKVELFDTVEIGESNILSACAKFQKEMSRIAGHLRSGTELNVLAEKIKQTLENYYQTAVIESRGEVTQLMKCRDILLTQHAVVVAMATAGAAAGSRGSGLFFQDKPEEDMLLKAGYIAENPAYANQVLMTAYSVDSVNCYFRRARLEPPREEWFESVWKEYNDRRGL